MTDSPPPPPADYDPIAAERPSAPVTDLGARIVAWRDGVCALGCPIGPSLLNRAGVLHGGVLSTLLDTASGYAGTFCPYPGRRRVAATLSLSVQFLDAARDGHLLVEAVVTRAGASVFFTEATAAIADPQATTLGPDAPPLARGSAVFKLRKGSQTPYGVPVYGDRRAN